MTWDWISFLIGVGVSLGILFVGVYFDIDDWFRK